MLLLEKTRNPLETTLLRQKLIIADDGYLWMQIAPQNANWWLTVMFDESHELIQYYFDITKGNILCGEESRFYNLFLDVVALPDERAALLDRDELDEARSEGAVTENEYALACQTAAMLMREIPQNIGCLARFCRDMFDRLYIKLK